MPLKVNLFLPPQPCQGHRTQRSGIVVNTIKRRCFFFLNLFFFIQFYILYFLLVSLVNYYDETKYWYLSIVKIKLNKIKFLIKKLSAISMYDSVYWYG